jgi:hypothetical protein
LKRQLVVDEVGIIMNYTTTIAISAHFLLVISGMIDDKNSSPKHFPTPCPTRNGNWRRSKPRHCTGAYLNQLEFDDFFC